jgi:ribosomal protein L40E
VAWQLRLLTLAFGWEVKLEMSARERQLMYCTHCGAPNGEGATNCGKCGAGIILPFKPSSRLSSNQLPQTLFTSLTPLQNSGLAFAVRNMTVKSATIQSFNTGSSSSGNVKFGGIGRGIGRWGVFGGMGSIHQHATHIFRTDIQIKLEDSTGTKAFLNYNLPFAITLSIDPGETLRVYFVKGGLSKPIVEGDQTINQWTPFAAEVVETGQIVPIAGLPTLEGEGAKLLFWGALSAFIGIWIVWPPLGGATPFGAFLLMIGVLCIGMYAFQRKAYLKAFSEAGHLAATATV